MPSTFATIKANIKDNLQDYSVYFSVNDLTTSVQDAYDEVIALSQCLIKKTTLNFQANLNYYDFLNIIDFPDIYVSDFMTCTAIFNNNTNLWLLDDKVLKDFDLARMDWENWTGQPVWWAPCNDASRIAIIPKLIETVGSFDLYYWAAAPVVIDTDIPLVPSDFQSLIEIHATASLLEIAHEFVKAKDYLDQFWGIDDGERNFESGIYALATRSKNSAKSDLLMLG